MKSDGSTLTKIIFCLLSLFFATSTFAAISDEMKNCLMQAMHQADDATVLSQMQQKCGQVANSSEQQIQDFDSKQGEGAVARKSEVDESNILKPFTLMAYRPNYLLFGAYNQNGYGTDDFVSTFGEQARNFKDVEARFQISIKFPLFIDLFDKKIDFYAAYTNKSFWQLYADEISAPFRETNHEPELWLQKKPNNQIFGLNNSIIQLGFNHQSNGRGGDLSRSWNRIFANFIFERGNFALSLKPWFRIEEDTEDDDNPDINDFLGYGEIRAGYEWKHHTIGVLLRNLVESDFSKGTFEVSWSFPFWNYEYIRGYVQYFNGYGESLIDYNRHANTIGVGVSLTDFL